MSTGDYRTRVEEVIETSDYLALGTSAGGEPWIAPIEYFRDAEGNFCFFSTTDSRHARHIEQNDTVAVAIWSEDQPEEYSPDLDAFLNGVQIRGTAYRVPEDEYSETLATVAEMFEAPMPPYAAYVVEPQRVYAPVIEDGINKRVEIDMS